METPNPSGGDRFQLINYEILKRDNTYKDHNGWATDGNSCPFTPNMLE
jgi:hypothetical protein